MSQHTPGSWTIEEYGDEECPALVIHRDSERRVCFMATPGSHGDPAMIEADARLIAAAPDLLQALKAAIHYLKRDTPAMTRGAINAAVAKATGNVTV